ncbi:DUF2510 domain-containing protein [Arthrobacter bambusae]|uniref:DUF2510 domain-containing protein n=1 Tax=Arthrobacter bambusae TaxID=1338426 RepID=UPI002787A6C0|nr:DUF2510 domain-containing protein [Arthrobacter bambusae]MDQ0031916.1 hypothetical protein [Arthrobacter bambusae]MDQ0100055.1 hypothetical protein [Arthrobacter bambusae]
MTERPMDQSRPAPGWYPDPAGSGRSLWWDGTAWSGYLPAAQPVAAPGRWRPLISPQTPVYNALIWLIVAAPLVVVVLQAAVWNPVPRFVYVRGVRTLDPSSIITPGYFVVAAAGVLAYAATIVAAYFDWKGLRRAGVVRPFHWAWAFLNLAVYVIGRSVVVRKVAPGRGLAPIWAFIGVYVVTIVISLAHASSMIHLFSGPYGY